MAAVYSSLLCEGDLAAFTVQSFLVPAGFKWVIRDIVWVNPNRTSDQASGIVQFLDDFGSPIAIWHNPHTVGSRQYHWVGHQVLESADHLNCFSFWTGTQFRVSGYKLSLP